MAGGDGLMEPRIWVFGPAYLDRAAFVDRPLLESGLVDRSANGAWTNEVEPERLILEPSDGALVIELPPDWPGPFGTVRLDDALGLNGKTRVVKAQSWRDDLGGMGAGLARALGGRLVCALGSERDPVSRRVLELLTTHHIEADPIRVEDRTADWSLVISSGRHGDKLAVGFRGCHTAVETWGERANVEADVVVAASLTNGLASEALNVANAGLRVFAPARRNVLDRDPTIPEFARSIDVLCCNIGEWSLIPESDRRILLKLVPLVSVTSGPQGAHLYPAGQEPLFVPLFPRSHEPLDTNHAGETYAATLVLGLLKEGWHPRQGPTDRAMLERVARRASAAAALVLDLTMFAFPTSEMIDEALARGIV